MDTKNVIEMNCNYFGVLVYPFSQKKSDKNDLIQFVLSL